MSVSEKRISGRGSACASTPPRKILGFASNFSTRPQGAGGKMRFAETQSTNAPGGAPALPGGDPEPGPGPEASQLSGSGGDLVRSGGDVNFRNGRGFASIRPPWDDDNLDLSAVRHIDDLVRNITGCREQFFNINDREIAIVVRAAKGRRNFEAVASPVSERAEERPSSLRQRRSIPIFNEFWRRTHLLEGARNSSGQTRQYSSASVRTIALPNKFRSINSQALIPLQPQASLMVASKLIEITATSSQAPASP